jgi:four helix bundle protein
MVCGCEIWLKEKCKMQNAKCKIDIYDRSFDFACRIVRLHRAVARGATARPLLNQLLRSGTSIGANLEEAEAGQSKADFIAKCRIALKEARETVYWLRLIAATELVKAARIAPLTQEGREIVAILTTIVRNASASLKRR